MEERKILRSSRSIPKTGRASLPLLRGPGLHIFTTNSLQRTSMSNDNANDAARDGNEKLEKTVETLRMRFGSRAVRRLGKRAEDAVPRMATGFSALDNALGGGLPRGRIVEITGRPTAGMATLALKIIAQAQAQGESAIYLDLEATFDPVYAARCGLILDRLLLVRPVNAHQAFPLLRDFADSGCGVLLCDLPPAMAADPSLAQALGQSLHALAHTDTVLLCLVPLPPGREEPPQTCPVSHYAAVRLQLQRERWLRRGEDIRGYRAQVFLAKNKLGATGRKITIDITFNGVVQGGRAGEGSV